MKQEKSKGKFKQIIPAPVIPGFSGMIASDLFGTCLENGKDILPSTLIVMLKEELECVNSFDSHDSFIMMSLIVIKLRCRDN